MQWFHEARFGMFIHFGLYSLLERGEWIMYAERIPPDEYSVLADQFAPAKCDPKIWASSAKEAGMKYAVFTARHHDGFSLYASKVSGFNSVETAAKRDFVAEFVEAFRCEGLKVGLYYSLADWRFPGYFEPGKYPENKKDLVEQAHLQIRELMTNYGRIDYLFYDGDWIPGIHYEPGRDDAELSEFWRAEEANAMVRTLQPHIIINNRSGLNEDVDTPEQHVTSSDPGRAWECCMTMGDFSGWGYLRNNPNWKTVPQLIQYLVTASAGEGNYLLNVGPAPDGSLRKEETDRLRAIGEWMSVNGESIYGSERCPFPSSFAPGGSEGLVGNSGVATARGNTVYIHVFRWPPGGEICIPNLKSGINSAKILSTNQKCSFEKITNCRTLIRGVPANPPDPWDTVIKLELDSAPQFYTQNTI